MKNKGLFILLAAVVLFGGYAIWDFRSERQDQDQKNEQAKVLPFSKDHLDHIQWQTSVEKVELKRDQDGWKLIQPIQDSADQDSVQQLVDSLSKESSTAVAVEGDQIQWKTFGLDPAVSVWNFKASNGQSRQVSIGGIKNFQGDSFLRFDDQKKVLIAGSVWHERSHKSALDFRDRRLFRPALAKIHGLRFSQDKKRITLEKKQDQWGVQGQGSILLDQNRVRDLLSQLQTVKGLEIVSEMKIQAEAKSTYQLDHPEQVLEIIDAEGKISKISFARSGPKKDVFAVLTEQPSFLMKLSASDYEKFQKLDVDSLRDREFPFKFDSASVTKIDFASPLKKFTLIKDKEWKIDPALPGKSVNQDKVETLFSKLKYAQVAQFQSKEKNLNKKISFLDKNQKQIFQFQWGDPIKEKKSDIEKVYYPVKTSLWDQNFLVDAALIDNLDFEQFFISAAAISSSPTKKDNSTSSAKETR